ncbi:tetratricopeptide repeat protein [Methanosarcina barkeri]|uniref:tetratricopeptide repeat protein n=1 Tax=Methanosarcina barkeri TaxID=2208 RepID=UPI000B20BE5D|nr:tetratricopeptide repeat protein [Methanosarcina barkeri]
MKLRYSTKKALELDPRHFGTLNGYAELLKEKGQYAAAEEIYRQAEFSKRSA